MSVENIRAKNKLPPAWRRMLELVKASPKVQKVEATRTAQGKRKRKRTKYEDDFGNHKMVIDFDNAPIARAIEALNYARGGRAATIHETINLIWPKGEQLGVTRKKLAELIKDLPPIRSPEKRAARTMIQSRGYSDEGRVRASLAARLNRSMRCDDRPLGKLESTRLGPMRRACRVAYPNTNITADVRYQLDADGRGIQTKPRGGWAIMKERRSLRLGIDWAAKVEKIHPERAIENIGVILDGVELPDVMLDILGPVKAWDATVAVSEKGQLSKQQGVLLKAVIQTGDAPREFYAFSPAGVDRAKLLLKNKIHKAVMASLDTIAD